MTSWRLFRGGNRGKSVSRKCGAKTNHKNRFGISFDDIKGVNAKSNQKKRFVIFSMISRVPMKTGKLKKNWDVPQAQVDDKVFQQLNLLITIGINLTCTLVEINNGDDDGDGDDAEKRDIRQILAGGQVRSVA